MYPTRLANHCTTELKLYFDCHTELTLEGDCVLWGTRAIGPLKLRDVTLQDLHHVHSVMVQMKGIARMYVKWPGMDHSIEQLAHACVSC